MKPIRKAAAALAVITSALVLAGCESDGYGSGYFGAGYDRYAYPPAWDYGYGYGYGSGWWDDYYYPGYDVYLYDRAGARHRWNNRQRQYWLGQGSIAPRSGRWAYGQAPGGGPDFGRRDGGVDRPRFEGRGGSATSEARPIPGRRGPLAGGSNRRRR